MISFLYKPFRIFIKQLKATRIKDEHPRNAWPEQYIRVKDRVVLDLGCGFFGKTHLFPLLENEGKKYTDMISTSEHFLNLGAKKVIGFDSNQSDVECLNKKLKNFVGHTIQLNHRKQLEDIILKENIDVVKSDIEGAEVLLYNVDDEIFKVVKEYYIETHDKILYRRFKRKLKRCNYEIREIMRQEQGGPASIIFAYQERWL